MSKESIFIQAGFLWDGEKHLSGKLELLSKSLIFHFDHFKESNLSFNIPLTNVKEVKVFKLYELTTNGLIIMDKTGRTNMFVIENPKELKKKIMKFLKLI